MLGNIWPKMTARAKITVLLLFVLPVWGCSSLQTGPPPPLVQQQTIESSPPGVSEESLIEGGVAILDPSPEGAAEGMRDGLAFEVFQGLRVGFPNVKVESRPDVDVVLAQTGLGRELNAFLQNFAISRHIDWEFLSRIGSTEKVRYLFFSRVEEVDKRTDIQMLNAGEALIRGRVTVFSSGPNMVPVVVTKRVGFYGELWDLRCRAVVWTGRGEAMVAEPSGGEIYREEDLFIRAGRLLIGSLQQSLKPAEKAAKC